MSARPRICLVSASSQNVFFDEILEAFGTALGEQGFTVECSTDCFPVLTDDLVYIYVPHEYHPFVEDLAHPTKTQLGRTVAICTEQPGTQWFETSCGIAAQAGGVIDLNVLGMEELRRRGIEAEHAPLGYVPAWDAWKGREERGRSIDLAFMGGHTERRAHVLSRCASAMTGRRSAVYLTETVQTHAAGNPTFLAKERKWRMLTDAKVLLNVHRSELPYMEWHRVIGALLNGCVVLTEHSLGTEPLVPGEHFVSSNYETLQEVLEGLLGQPERIEEIRQAAYALVRERMPMSNAVEGLVRAIERASRNPAGFAKRAPTAIPLPLPLPPRTPGWQADAEYAGESLPLRTALKHLVVKSRGLERQLERLSAPDSLDEPIVEQLGPPCPRPRISVLLTVHDYADYVGEALRSVALSNTREIEVIAIDDASTDDSVEAVRNASGKLPWLSVKLVRLPHNRGLPVARNLALEHARADLLFVLDADNLVLPDGFEKLERALAEHSDAAFAYGIIESFDINGPTGLMNWLDWDPTRLRQGNYIDAMAMIRRSALEATGGYSTDPALSGWEDFDLWVKMASKGLRGVRVPDFIARYRQSPHSMITLTNVDSLSSWNTLLRRHPALSKAETT